MHTSAKALYLTLDIIRLYEPLSIVLFPVPTLGTIAYAPSYFIYSTYLIVDAWLGNMSDARSISSRIRCAYLNLRG
jgi:hypothetical protein